MDEGIEAVTQYTITSAPGPRRRDSGDSGDSGDSAAPAAANAHPSESCPSKILTACPACCVPPAAGDGRATVLTTHARAPRAPAPVVKFLSNLRCQRCEPPQVGARPCQRNGSRDIRAHAPTPHPEENPGSPRPQCTAGSLACAYTLPPTNTHIRQQPVMLQTQVAAARHSPVLSAMDAANSSSGNPARAWSSGSSTRCGESCARSPLTRGHPSPRARGGGGSGGATLTIAPSTYWGGSGNMTAKFVCATRPASCADGGASDARRAHASRSRAARPPGLHRRQSVRRRLRDAAARAPPPRAAHNAAPVCATPQQRHQTHAHARRRGGLAHRRPAPRIVGTLAAPLAAQTRARTRRSRTRVPAGAIRRRWARTAQSHAPRAPRTSRSPVCSARRRRTR